MKKNKNSVYIRYEFSDEKGRLEGGDILHFPSLTEVQDLASEILTVAHGDKVAVNITVGREAPFFGFLKEVGLSEKDLHEEMVNMDLVEAIPTAMKKSKGTTQKKAAKKTIAKKAKTGKKVTQKKTAKKVSKKKK